MLEIVIKMLCRYQERSSGKQIIRDNGVQDTKTSHKALEPN